MVIRRLGLALLTALLLVCSFPLPDQGWLAWGALVPLVAACRGISFLPAALLGVLAGMVANLGIFSWVFHHPGFELYHGILAAAYLSCYFALWCGFLPLLRRLPRASLVGIPGLWVALDYLKAHLGFMAIPWAVMAHSQHSDLPFLQLATLTGEYGPTFLVVMMNVALAGLVMKRNWRAPALVLMIVAAVHLWGYRELENAVPDGRLKVALAQPSILLSERATVPGRAATFERLKDLTREVAAERPALVAWPETAIRDLRNEPRLMVELQNLARELDTHLVVGASEFTKLSRTVESDEGPVLTLVPRTFNSAYLVAPDGRVDEPYHKILLVPFAEYLPLEGTVPWPKWLVPSVYNHMPGSELRTFLLDGGVRFAVRICWEGIFSDLIRPSVREGARLLVQINNANWFGRSAAEPQHNLASALRAVEYRMPVVISSNTGPSGIVDAFGRVVAGVPGVFTHGTASAEVDIFTEGTFYARRGDLFAVGTMVLTAAILAVAAARRRRDP